MRIREAGQKKRESGPRPFLAMVWQMGKVGWDTWDEVGIVTELILAKFPKTAETA